MDRTNVLRSGERATEELERFLGKLSLEAPRLRTAMQEALLREEISGGDLYLMGDLLPFSRTHNRADLALLLFRLLAAMRKGSLCLPVDQEFPEQLARRLLHEEPTLASADCSQYVPLLFRMEKGVHHLYFQKFFVRKQILLERLSAIFRVERSRSPRLDEILSHILEENPVRLLRPDGTWRPMELAPEQRAAMVLALSQNFLIVTGGPGTGKTSTVLNLLRAAVRTGLAAHEIRLAAPTGRAARRMGESIRNGINGLASQGTLEAEDDSLRTIPAVTLHRLLEYRPGTDTFMYGPMNRLPSRMVIVDEISMVDLLLMSRLLEAVDPERTTLVFLGDRDQLPSVEAGAVLADLVQMFAEVQDPRLQNRLVLLEKSHRSADPIMRAARWIREHKDKKEYITNNQRRGEGELPMDRLEPSLCMGPDPRWPTTGCHHLAIPVDPGKRDGARSKRLREAILSSWIRHIYSGEFLDLIRTVETDAMEQGSPAQLGLFRALFRHLNASRILTLLRRGAEGSEGINRIAERTLRNMARNTREAAPLPGLPIMVTRNDPARELYNGDVGLLLTFPDGSSRALFEHGESYRLFALDALPAHEAAFAITVHKSQGSEYDRILLVLPGDPEHPLLTGEILYTGLTRAKTGAVLLGSEAALRAGRARFIHRETGSMELFESPIAGEPKGGEK